MAIVICVSQDAAKILIDPKNVTSTEGQSAAFECNLEGQPLSKVTWWKGSTQVNTSDSRYQLSSPSSVADSKVTLTITKVIRSDEGFYQCEAQNQLGRELSNSAYLNVNCKLFLSVLLLMNSLLYPGAQATFSK